MSYQPRWPRHKLTSAEGERMLWHMIAHLQATTYCDDRSAYEAIGLCRRLINQRLIVLHPKSREELILTD